MKNKMVIIIGVIVILFVALYFIIDYKNDKAIGDYNPYGKTDLQQGTIDQLKDPNYRNQILPDELEEALANEEDMFVYFYDPTCHYCQQTTPILVPLTEELGVDMKKLNLLEFQSGWSTYGVESTPTLVYYENGKEVDRVNGAQQEEMFRAFFEEYNVE